MSALHPTFLRLGGSQDNNVKYEFGEMSLSECEEPVAFRGKQITLCLTRQRWEEVLGFYNATGAALVFGTSFTHSNARDHSGVNMTNIEALLAYTAASGSVKVAGLELGEEMNPDPPSPQFDDLVLGYVKLKALAAKMWPSAPPTILGPSVGMGDEKINSKFMNGFLNATLPTHDISAVNMHSYNNDGGWPNPGWLSQTAVQADAMLEMTRRLSAIAQLWCGECGPHNGGGKSNVTDRFVSSFWYADALGGFARLGFSQFGRQALVGSHYGLLQETSHTPNPDYWTLLGWKRLMGTGVLDVTVASPPTDHWHWVNKSLHVYAHCSRVDDIAAETAQQVGSECSGGNVTLLYINISPSTTFELSVHGAFQPTMAEYHFTSGADGLLSHDALLNGELIKLSEDAAVPEYKAVDGSQTVVAKPHSFGFVVLQQSSRHALKTDDGSERSVSWWFAPAPKSGASHAWAASGNVTAALALLRKYGGSAVASSLLLYCGDSISPNGSFHSKDNPACEVTTTEVQAMGIGVERVIQANGPQGLSSLRAMFKDPADSIAGIAAMARRLKLKGVSWDIEPHNSTIQDAADYDFSAAAGCAGTDGSATDILC